jgi:hypothetical protein
MNSKVIASSSEPSLVALARAGAEAAKWWFTARRVVQVGILAVGLIALIAPDTWMWVPYGLAVAAWAGEGCSWFLNYTGRKLQAAAETCRRRSILIEALGPTQELVDAVDLHLCFNDKIKTKARTLDDPAYYASKEGVGIGRLKEMLQESAFWSKHLYRAAAGRSATICVVLAIGIIAIVILGWPVAIEDKSLLLPRALVIFLGFVVAFDELGRWLDWMGASEQVEAVDRRLERIDGSHLEPLLAVFSDYGVATASAPPIPTRVYTREKDRLNDAWSKRLAKPTSGQVL